MGWGPLLSHIDSTRTNSQRNKPHQYMQLPRYHVESGNESRDRSSGLDTTFESVESARSSRWSSAESATACLITLPQAHREELRGPGSHL